MGLFDLFKKKKPDDGTFHRTCRAEEMTAFRGSAAFRMTIQDVFTITGRGCVVTGRIETGNVTIGDRVTLKRTDGSTGEVTVTGIEMFRKMTNTASAGDNVGLLLRNVERGEVGRGDLLEKMW